MSNEIENKQETNKRNGQYGKKGFKPRKSAQRGNCDLDKIETNDPKYWNKAKNFENVSKFKWDLIVGYPRDWDNIVGCVNPSSLSVGVGTDALNPAQMMVIDVVLGPGWSRNVNDGVNRSLAKLMADIRSTLSTSNIGFETAELGYLFASTSSIAANIAYAKRVLESYSVWKDRNYVYPRMLIEMMGFKYTDIRDHIQKYSAILNSLIDMYNHIGLLDIFDTYERQYAMMHNIFCDEDSELAQLYIFRPANYYIYNDKESRCESYAFDFDNDVIFTDFGDFLNAIETQINAWYDSTDLYQINGVLHRAFKDAPKQVIPYFESGTKVEPVQDKAFLMQIMNCTICPLVDSTGTSLNITQDPLTQNFVIWKPSSTVSLLTQEFGNLLGTCFADKQVLRLYDTDISQDDNMEMTRLMNFCEVNDPIDKIEYVNCGSEIVTAITVAVYNTLEDRVTVRAKVNSNLVSSVKDSSFIALVQAFRYMPTFIMYTPEGPSEDPSSVIKVEGILGDIYNWMLYDRVDWNLLQFAAYQSLWTPKNL